MSDKIEIIGVTKAYGGEVVVDNISLDIEAGEFFTLLGSSGSGKSTTLMMIAGFVDADAGDIRIGGRSVRALPPERRDLGVVFQSYALFPHMSVAQNIAFPLRMRNLTKANQSEKVDKVLDLVGLAGFGERRISQLSGGQQQRVALARSLVFEPRVLLMDEPLGALDRNMREQMQVEFKRLQEVLGVTLLYVTHDQDEALTLSDRIAVMSQGRIEQVGSPADVYERPRNLFVARFLGESNEFDAELLELKDGLARLWVKGASAEIAARYETDPKTRHVKVVVRLEDITFVSSNGENHLKGRIRSIEYLGRGLRYTVETPEGSISVTQPRLEPAHRRNIGDHVEVTWRSRDSTCFACGRPEGRS